MKNTTQMPEQSATIEIIDTEELSHKLRLPISWIKEQTRSRATDKIPHLRFGRYVRFAWGSPELHQWLRRRQVNCGK